MLPTLTRWAERKGCTVEWGNIIGPYIGQTFYEIFATEAQANERVRQALAKESIPDNREPVAIRRVQLY